MGHGRLGQTRQQQTTDWGQSRAERAGVTDGLGLPASLLISRRGGARDTQAARAAEQTSRRGRQTDRRTNAAIGRRPASRQMHRHRLQTAL